MALYEYRCPDGHSTEVFHKMDETPEVRCSVCGAAAERVISTPMIHTQYYFSTQVRQSRYPRHRPSSPAAPTAAQAPAPTPTPIPTPTPTPTVAQAQAAPPPTAQASPAHASPAHASPAHASPAHASPAHGSPAESPAAPASAEPEPSV